MADQVYESSCENEEPQNLTPFERFEAGLQQLLSISKEQAEQIRLETRKEKNPQDELQGGSESKL